MRRQCERLEHRLLFSTWYVSAIAGAATNPGTLGQPFATIQQAADVAQPGDTVYIRGGTYRETVVPANSGAAGAPITYEPFPGEQVTIDGADPVTGWSAYQGLIQQAALPWDLGDGANQVFVDGQMINEARWPNSGPDVSHPTFATVTSASVQTGSNGLNVATIGVPLNDPAGAWVGATIHISPGQAWVTQTGTVIASSPGSLTYEYQPLSSYQVPAAGNHFFLTGLFRGLDNPGEWFRDNAGNLYLRAPQDADPSLHSVEAKRRLYAFDLSGTSYTDIVGLNLFACTINTDGNSANDTIDGITARYISHQTINPYPWYAQDHPHTSGIILNGTNDLIENSTIRYSSGDGVFLAGSGNIARNNVVSEVDYAGGDESGITDFGPGNQVIGNTIFDCGRSGLVFRHAPGSLISRNVIHDVGIQETDLGCIYTFGDDSPGTEVSYNVVYNVHTGGFGAAGIYLDNRANHVTVDHNLSYNCDYALKMNPPCDNNQIYNNTLVGTSYSVASSGNEEMTGSVFANNIFTSNLQIGSGASQTNNLYSSNDPKFVNASAGNFQLAANSPAIDAGQIIATYTDGYVGAGPDIGAYEYGLAAFSSGSTLPAPPPPTTIWSDSAAPATSNQNVFDPTIAPSGGVELGLKFQSDAAGFVTGVRFWKGARNTGTHTGELWSATGQLLATATFTNESGSGWQAVSFSNPVPITPKTTYVVSYQDSSSYLAYTGGALAGGVNNPPLHALAGGTSGGNSVYQNDAVPGVASFPSTYNGNAASYWVDVIFNTQGTPTPPATLLAIATSPTSVSLSWSPSAGAVTAYHVERSADGINFSEIAPSVSGTSYVDNTAQPATSYVYRVRAEDAVSFSGYGNSAAAVTAPLPPPPAPPPYLSAVAWSSTQVFLTWLPADGTVTAYHVERSTDGTNFTEVAAVDQTSYLDTVTGGATYTYRVRAENAGSFSQYTDTEQLTIGPTSAPADSAVSIARRRAAAAKLPSPRPAADGFNRPILA